VGAFRQDLDPQAAARIIMGFFLSLPVQLRLGALDGEAAVAQIERWITGQAAS
jgi:hypothetical protein